VLWAFLGVRGKLYVRRNVGSLSEPAWRPLVSVRDVTPGNVGAGSPGVVRFDATHAPFHAYPDTGNLFQGWLTTSSDNGATWSAPVKLTAETGHVGRVQAVVDGGTVRLFSSRQDTNGRLSTRTSTDLSNWSAKTTVSQSIGAAAKNVTSNFGVVKLASGSWLRGWIAPSSIGEAPNAPAGSLDYPAVTVATSADLAAWSSATELNLAYSHRWPASVVVGQDPATATIRALFEQFNDAHFLQRDNALPVVAQLQQHLFGMLADLGRAGPGLPGRAVKVCGAGDHPRRAVRGGDIDPRARTRHHRVSAKEAVGSRQ
jgi:hypothetical protein